MYQTEHAKRFRVFRNGDRGFLGKISVFKVTGGHDLQTSSARK